MLIVGRSQTLLRGVKSALAAIPAAGSTRQSASGREGLCEMRTLVPALVLLIAPLPDLDVREFIDEVRRISPAVRVILIENAPELPGAARARQAGADGFVSGRLLERELPLVLERLPTLSSCWGSRFSPWKEGYGEA